MYEYTNKRIWKQTLAREYYLSLAREDRKVSLQTFISRIHKGLDYNEAMNRPYLYRPKTAASIKHPERTEYRDNYQWEKCPYQRFYARMMWGTMSMEEAISPEFRKGWYVNKYGKSTKTWGWGISIKHADTLVKNPDHYVIDITYNEEEAQVFKDQYQDMINKLQKQYNKEEDTSLWSEILKKLNWIKEEYQTFLTFNK